MIELKTNRDVLILQAGLGLVPDDVSFPDKKKRVATFKFTVSNVKREVDNYVKSLEDIRKWSPEFKEYRKEDRELSEKYCARDENGKPVQHPISRTQVKYAIPGEGDPESEYSKELKKLREKHKDAIEKQEAKEEEFVENLDAEVNMDALNLIYLDYDQVPFDSLPQRALDGLIFLIKDPIGEGKPKKTKK